MIKQFLLTILGEQKYLETLCATFQVLLGRGCLTQSLYKYVYFLKRHIHTGDTCIDIGAHLGYYSRSSQGRPVRPVLSTPWSPFLHSTGSSNAIKTPPISQPSPPESSPGRGQRRSRHGHPPSRRPQTVCLREDHFRNQRTLSISSKPKTPTRFLENCPG